MESSPHASSSLCQTGEHYLCGYCAYLIRVSHVLAIVPANLLPLQTMSEIEQEAPDQATDNKRTHDLRTQPIPKLLLRYAIPAVVGTVVQALYNIVDTIFIGQGSGELGIAAVYIGFPLIILLLGFSMLVGTGASVGVSIALGRRDSDRADRILSNAVYLTFGFYILTVTPSIIFLEDILRLIGASDNIIPLAMDYLHIYLPAIILSNLTYGYNNVMRASGYPTKAMITMLLGAVINVILDYLFIMRFGWGIKGAAWATAIAMFCTMVFVQYHFFQRKSVVRFKGQNMKPSGPILLSIISVGIAPFAMQVAGSAVSFVLNNNFSRFATTVAEADLSIATYGIINNYTTLIALTIIGVAQGMQPIVGYNYGAGQIDRSLGCYKLAVVVNTIISFLGFAAAMLMPEELFRLFNASPELIEIGQRAIRIVFSVFFVVGFQITTSQLFQSLGQSRQAIFISLTRQIIFLLPALLVLPHFYGIDGVWYAIPLGDLLATVVSAAMIIYYFKKWRGEQTAPLA